jgi:hypothetical protein
MTPATQSTDSARNIPVRPNQTVLWIIAFALVAIAVALLVRPGAPLMPAALAQQAMLGSRGFHAFTGQLDRNTWGLFMMDVDAGNVWVYEYLPRKRSLKLVAARSFTHDRYLEDYNTEEPSPLQVAELLRREQQAKRRAAALGIEPAHATQPDEDDADDHQHDQRATDNEP